jgi:hypothetical protein
MNTQLSSTETYDVSRMVFSKAVKGAAKTGEGEPQIKFSRIMISTKNEDGSIGELVFPTTEVFSFGVSTNTSQDTGKVNGYSLPLCLWNKDAPTDQEKAFSSKLEEVVERCKDHLLLPETKDETEKYDLERSELKKLNSFIYWKRDKGKIVDGTGPTLYPKLIESKKNNKIITVFFDQNGNNIDPLSLIGKYCWAKAAIKIESVFVGAKIAIQVKVYEAEIRLIDGGVKRLLHRPAADTKVHVNETMSFPLETKTAEEENDDDDEQIQDTKPQTPPPVQEAVPVRKTVRKVAVARK